MYAKNINPAEVNVNGEMIASVNYFFFALQNVHLKQNDEEYRKQKHNNLNSLNERASKKKERKKIVSLLKSCKDDFTSSFQAAVRRVAI